MTRDLRTQLVGAAVLGSYPLLVAAALWPQPWLFLVFCVMSYAAEIAARRGARQLVDLLSQAHLGVTLRFVIREMTAILLVARTEGTDSPWFMALAVGLFLMHGVRAVQTWLAISYNRTLSRLPALTRNIDAVRIPAPPRDILVNYQGLRFLYLDVLPVGGAALGATLGTGYQGAAGAAIALGLELMGALALLPHLRRVRPLRDTPGVLRAVDEHLSKYRPEVVLYFSGPNDSAYQATMWLRPLERIDRRALVVLRERDMLRMLGDTSLPVVCIPSAADLMGFAALDTARVCLYPANVGKNIHMLRIRGLRGVFVGHGDSDKEASFNPFTKVYDEVWVAGQAGRDRYIRAQVGVRDENVYEVGRPQLSGVSTGGPELPYRTVLYAPTWEGWTDDLFHTSIITMGPGIVRMLLAHSPELRIIYKPHPLTGYRNLAARRAHQKIHALLEKRELSRSMARHPAGTALAMATSSAGTARSMPGHSAGAAWSQPIRHQVVTGQEPSLYDCFNQADLMITDISSVVADFIASGKPYMVTNVSGMPERLFRERYPSSEAGYLLGEDLAELPAVLQALEHGAEDVLASTRRKLKTYLLGPDHPDAMARFNNAVNDACNRASARGR
jgi:hypothetical protein